MITVLIRSAPQGGGALGSAPLDPPPLLQVRDLAFTYATAPVLVDLDLEVMPGTCSVIRGENGTGKSTLLHLLQGRLQPSRGWVRLEGRPLRGRRRRVALVPQVPSLNWRYPIRLAAMVAMAAKGDPRTILPALRQVGLEALGERLIGRLSTGQPAGPDRQSPGPARRGAAAR